MQNVKERLDYYKETLLKIINKHIPDCAVYLFGSRARKTAQEGADIDIAIDSKSLINLNKILDIYGEIEESTIPVKVDIIDFRNVSNEMKKEIERDGILWTK